MYSLATPVSTIIPVLHMGKLMHKEVEQFA